MSKIPSGARGFCYLLGNDSMPGLIKIGATTDLPDHRAKQLTAATASPTPFTVLYSRKVDDCTRIEADMHTALAAHRVNERREFFRVSIYEAATTLDRLCGSARFMPNPTTPFAEMFASFPDDGSDRELTPEEQAKCRALERRTL